MDNYSELTYRPVGEITGDIEADGRIYVITNRLYVYEQEFDGAVYLYEFMGTVGEMCEQSKEFRIAFKGE